MKTQTVLFSELPTMQKWRQIQICPLISRISQHQFREMKRLIVRRREKS